ncbi:hypothetical protein [Sphingobacterium sp. JB170]|uniref:hypothetical protein n=1 Tax=Sphingobacterium sp. JB170 TaxID=1434842 RepID=UPI000B3614F3|nr:hypothetical protein [Sphingobacterium sp. JB170]
MFVNLLIVAIVSILIRYILKFFAGILLMPFNALSLKRMNYDSSVHFYRLKWHDLLMVILSFVAMTYLISGVCASMLSWISEQHPENLFAKIFSLAAGSYIASGLSRDSALLYLQDQKNQIQTFPAFMGCMYVKLGVYVICVLFLIFPDITKYWSWMPYVK